jgi:hypothetical protein
MVLYLCVLIVFSLHQKSIKLILVDEPIPEVVLSQSSNSCSICIQKLEPKHCKFSSKKVNCANINKIPRRISSHASTFGLEYRIAQVLIHGFHK